MILIWSVTIFLMLVDIPITIYGTNKLGLDVEGNQNVKSMLEEKNYWLWTSFKLERVIYVIISLYILYKMNDIYVLGSAILTGLGVYFFHFYIIANWLLTLWVY